MKTKQQKRSEALPRLENALKRAEKLDDKDLRKKKVKNLKSAIANTKAKL